MSKIFDIPRSQCYVPHVKYFGHNIFDTQVNFGYVLLAVTGLALLLFLGVESKKGGKVVVDVAGSEGYPAHLQLPSGMQTEREVLSGFVAEARSIINKASNDQLGSVHANSRRVYVVKSGVDLGGQSRLNVLYAGLGLSEIDDIGWSVMRIPRRIRIYSQSVLGHLHVFSGEVARVGELKCDRLLRVCCEVLDAQLRALSYMKGVSSGVRAMNSGAGLNDVQAGNEDNEPQGYALYNKSFIFSGFLISIGFYIGIYKVWRKISFDFSGDVNVSGYAALVIVLIAGTCCGFLIAAHGIGWM